MSIREETKLIAGKNHSLCKQAELKKVALHKKAVLQIAKAMKAVTKLCHHKHSKQTSFELKHRQFSADIGNNTYKYIVSKQLQERL